jgi:outer membrane protein
MKMKQFKWVCLVVLGALHPAKAQQSLPLSAAIDTALYNNLGLIISRNQASIAANNLSYGNAGMLPRIDLNAGANLASNNLNQKFNTGNEINKKGVVTKAYNGQLALNWTLFDGTKMFATYQKLEVLKSMGELNVQIKSEELVANVTKAYAEIVRQKILLQGTQNNISLYEERVKLAEARLQLGKSSRTELLQASVDLNLQKSNLIKQKTLLKNSMTTLNRSAHDRFKHELDRFRKSGFKRQFRFAANA